MQLGARILSVGLKLAEVLFICSSVPFQGFEREVIEEEEEACTSRE